MNSLLLFGADPSGQGLGYSPNEVQSMARTETNRLTCIAIHDSQMTNGRNSQHSGHSPAESQTASSSIVTFRNHSPGIRELCLGCDLVDEQAVKTIMHYLAQTRHISQITYVSDARKSVCEQQKLMECLANGLKDNQRVTRLECVAFNFCHPPSFDALVQFLFQRGMLLKRLDLSHCRFDLTREAYMIPYLTYGLRLTQDTLLHLDLQKASLGSDEAVAAVIRALQSPKSQLQYLDLRTSALGGASMIALADFLIESTKLQYLFFSYNFFSGLTKAHKQYFMDSVKLKNCSLRTINLIYCPNVSEDTDSSRPEAQRIEDESDTGTDDELIEVDSIEGSDDDDSQQMQSVPTQQHRVGFFAADKITLDLYCRRNRNIDRIKPLLQERALNNASICHALAWLNRGRSRKETSLSATYHIIHHMAVSSQLRN